MFATRGRQRCTPPRPVFSLRARDTPAPVSATFWKESVFRFTDEFHLHSATRHCPRRAHCTPIFFPIFRASRGFTTTRLARARATSARLPPFDIPRSAARRWWPRSTRLNGANPGSHDACASRHGCRHHRPASRVVLRSRLHHLQSAHRRETRAPSDRKRHAGRGRVLARHRGSRLRRSPLRVGLRSRAASHAAGSRRRIRRAARGGPHSHRGRSRRGARRCAR